MPNTVTYAISPTLVGKQRARPVAGPEGLSLRDKPILVRRKNPNGESIESILSASTVEVPGDQLNAANQAPSRTGATVDLSRAQSDSAAVNAKRQKAVAKKAAATKPAGRIVKKVSPPPPPEPDPVDEVEEVPEMPVPSPRVAPVPVYVPPPKPSKFKVIISGGGLPKMTLWYSRVSISDSLVVLGNEADDETAAIEFPPTPDGAGNLTLVIEEDTFQCRSFGFVFEDEAARYTVLPRCD